VITQREGEAPYATEGLVKLVSSDLVARASMAAFL
jgi:hypothetical protein